MTTPSGDDSAAEVWRPSVVPGVPSASPFVGAAREVGRITAVEGSAVLVGVDGRIIPSAPGDPVFEGDAIQVPRSGLLTVTFAGGHTVTLSEGAIATIESGEPSGAVIAVESGSFVTTPAPGRAGAIALVTPLATFAAAAPIAGRCDRLNGLDVVLLADPDGAAPATSAFAGPPLALARRLDHVRVTGADDPMPTETLDAGDDRLALARRLGWFGGDPAREEPLEAGAPMGEETSAGDEEFESSPGGDLEAFTADPTVTRAAAAYDLAPEVPTPPGAPPPLEPVGAPSPVLGLRPTAEILLYQPSFPTVAPPKPTIFREWDAPHRWVAVGNAAEVTGDAELAPGSERPITAPDGVMAQLSAHGLTMAELETFLSAGPGSLVGVGGGAAASRGAAIRTVEGVDLRAGESVYFDVFYDAADRPPLDDYAVMTITTQGGTVVAEIADTGSVEPKGASGWRTLQYTAGANGTYHFGFAMIDDGEEGNFSRLYVDHMRRADPSPFEMVELHRREDELGGLIRLSAARPDAHDDVLGATAFENAPLSISARDLLANDVDPDAFDEMILVAVDSSGTLGVVTLASGLPLSYVAGPAFDHLAPGQTSTDHFRYGVDGGTGLRDFATVTVRVVGENDAPVAIDDLVDAGAGAATPIDILADNGAGADRDVDDGDRLSLSAIEGVAARVGAVVTLASGATVEMGADGAVVYRAGSGFEALAEGERALDQFDYTIVDHFGGSGTARVTVTVAGRNDAPIAVDDAVDLGEGEAAALPLLANDRDPDHGDAVSIHAVEGVTLTPGGTVALAPGVVLRLTESGLVFDDPSVFDALAVDETRSLSFTYQVADRAGLTSDAVSATVTIHGENDAPTAGDDVATALDGGGPRAIDVLANDDDVDSDDAPRDLAIVAAKASSGAEIHIVEGRIVYDAGVRFQALGVGEVGFDHIEYVVADRHGATANAVVSVIIEGANDAPVATGEVVRISENETIAIDAAANDRDPDASDRLRIVAIDGEAIEASQSITLASGASVTLGADGTLRYDPGGAFDELAFGAPGADAFDYTVSDGHGGLSTARVELIVTGANDAPTAVDDEAAANEDGGPVRIAVLADDYDPDGGDVLHVVSIDGQTVTTPGQAVRLASGADVIVETDGTLRYEVGEAFQSLGEGESVIERFDYVVSDGREGAVGRLVVTVSGQNDAPVAADDHYVVSEGVVLRFVEGGAGGLLDNDLEPDRNDVNTVVAVNGAATAVGAVITLASGALLTVNADGTFTYDQNGAFEDLPNGQFIDDEFDYTVADAHGGASSATASLRIIGANDPPIAVGDVAHTDADAAVRLWPTWNDVDPENTGPGQAQDSLRVVSLDLTGTSGVARINADGSLTYDPGDAFADLAIGETAQDVLRYELDDRAGGRSWGEITITVHGTESSVATNQQLIGGFEDGAGLLSSGWEREPGQGAAGDAVRRVGVGGGAPGYDAFAPTQLDSAVLLRAEGSFANGGDAGVSPIERFLELPAGTIPVDVDGSSATTGSAIRTTIVLGPADLGPDGATTLTFDWNFLSNESPAAFEAGANDSAIFTVSSGAVSRVFTLADAREIGLGASGWRVGALDLADFLPPGASGATLTIGFAALNDADELRPSQLLIDNVRLNRPISDDAVEIAHDGNGDGFHVYRLVPEGADDAGDDLVAFENGAVTIAGDRLLANDLPSVGAIANSLAIVGLAPGTPLGVEFVEGELRYDPSERFDHLAQGETGIDHFRYRLTDANGGVGEADVAIRITGMNDAPVAALDAATSDEDQGAIVIDVIANDDDVDSDDDASTLRVISASASSGATITFTGLPGDALRYAISAEMSLLSEGETAHDVITYVVRDRHGATSEGQVEVAILGRNDIPTAAADDAATSADASVRIAVAANDADPDRADRLTVARVNGASIGLGQAVTLSSGAIVALAADGALAYDPNGAFAQLAAGQNAIERFSYTVTDGHGGFADAIVAVFVTGVNDAPVTSADAISVADGASVATSFAQLLANDRDLDAGDALRVSGVAGPGVTLGAAGFVYDAGTRFQQLAVGETATEDLVYTVVDRLGLASQGRVTVTIHGRNDAPVAADDAGATAEDETVTLDVLANDRDPDAGDRPAITTIDTTETRGIVSRNPDGTLTYDPAGRFDELRSGETVDDRFSYTVSDGHGGLDVANVIITVTGRGDIVEFVNSFEKDLDGYSRLNSAANVVSAYVDPNGATEPIAPTDGASMLRISADLSFASSVATYVGLTSLPKDVDDSFAATGSAIKLSKAVSAGDLLTFDWLFDARDSAPDNDYALFTVQGDGAATKLFTLADVRSAGDFGNTGWRSFVYEAQTTGEITLSFAVVNDARGDFADDPGGRPPYVSQNSVLLLDNIRLRHDAIESYQIAQSHHADPASVLPAGPHV